MRTNYYAPKPMDGEAIKRQAYRDQGILVVRVDDHRVSWPEREVLRQVAEKLYGRPQPRSAAARA